MPDSSDIDNAVIAALLADSTLMAFTPDGVFWEEAPASIASTTRNPERFVVVSMVNPSDVPMFGGRAFEANVYMVKAVMLSSSGGDIKSAAARIDALFDPQPPAPPATLTIAGYTLACLRRNPDLARIRTVEEDPEDPSIRWQHRGGYYDVWATA